jgi:hypothetical protein
MKNYIGVKAVQATPMTVEEYNQNVRPLYYSGAPEGYLVVYPDGYQSWSPKDVFEKAYLQVGDNNTIVEQNVHDFIKDMDISQWGDKTTIVNATLANGFVITEASSCVDPANFNMDIGASICKDRVYNKVWELLGFLLQCAQKGIKI